MSEFNGDDFEFAAGSIKGLRSWDMDTLGRLHGVTHAEVWKPGENIAVCKATKAIPCDAPKPKAEKKKPKKKDPGDELWTVHAFTFYEEPRPCGQPTCDGTSHHVPTGHDFDANCQCGFWAYDEHSFSPHGQVVGIIDAFGKTTIGTRGFRAEKAQIVALCRDGGKGPLSLSAWLRLQQLYKGVEFYDTRDEMVTAHGSVLRQWGMVHDRFWDVPVVKPDEGSWNVSKGWMTHYLSSAMRYTATPSRWHVGGSIA